MVDDPFMNWTSKGGVWKLRKRSFKMHWKKPKLLWNKKRIEWSELSLNWDKLGKKLIERFKKKRRSLTIPGKTTKEQWTQCRPHWKLKEELRQKLCESKRNLNLTSMNWKLLLIIATKPMLKLTNLSNATKFSSEMLSKLTRKRADKGKS